jgi:hypothetical protein
MTVFEDLNGSLGFNKAENKIPKAVIPGKLDILVFNIKDGVLVFFPNIKGVLGNIRLRIELLQEIQALFKRQFRRQPVKMPAFYHNYKNYKPLLRRGQHWLA